MHIDPQVIEYGGMKDSKCAVEGCDEPVRYKGLYTGKFSAPKKVYGVYCQFHHRNKEARKGKVIKYRFSSEARDRFPNKKCERCGWDKAYCDRHRIDPSLGYVAGNVLVLCPNCHRIETVNSA